MKKLREMSENAQSLVVSVSMGVLVFGVAFAIKLFYQLF
jgi:hypothetical protein